VSSKPKWTKEKCQEEALKYNHKIDFKKQSTGAYQAAGRNKWIDDICLHMTSLGNEYKRLIYRFIFPNNVCYVGLTNNFERRVYEHLNKKGTIYSYINIINTNPIVEKLTDYIPVDKAKELEEYWKCKSEEDGFICLNIAKTGGVGSFYNLKWTKEECEKEANKYKTRFEFQINSHSAYNSARKNNWIDEICSHMTIKHKIWTKDKCEIDAYKYNSRSEYAKNNRNSWYAAKKHNWLDEICSHMIKLREKSGYWTIENCITEAKKYNKSGDLKRNKPNVYQIICKNNLIDVIYSKTNNK
jgi:predicted GIY-YIG superfamily endonuclease